MPYLVLHPLPFNVLPMFSRATPMPFSLRSALPALMALFALSSATAQTIGISGGIPAPVDPFDTTLAASWLPFAREVEPAGTHGFLQSDGEGRWSFQDGTPARFVGTTLSWAACFPEPQQAQATARHLRRLGVNLVRLEYFDHSYSWWTGMPTILSSASGFRTLDTATMARFDGLIHALKQNGIYVQLPLQSGRTTTPEDGLRNDSLLWLDATANYLYPQARAAWRSIARQLLDHVNPHTGTAYRDEPAIAMLETRTQGSLIALDRINYINYTSGSGTIPWYQSRRLDTLYAAYLRTRYASTAALRNAWESSIPANGGPNQISEGSFEGEYDSVWYINSNSGTTVTQILSQDSVPDGSYSLKLRVRNTLGNIYTASMQHAAHVEFDHLYRLSFKARCNNPEGRRMLVYGSEQVNDGLSVGLNGSNVEVKPWWEEHEIYFIVPVRPSADILITFFYGDVDGELEFDDVQLREVKPGGLQSEESIDNATVQRIPAGNSANLLAHEQRVVDQNDFMVGLEQEFYSDARRLVHDSVGARQPLAGSSGYWATGRLDAAVAGSMEYVTGGTGWDYNSTGNGSWYIRNYSPLRAGYSAFLYNTAMLQHRRKPMIALTNVPYPNRYQAESMVLQGVYAGLQGWDGVVWGTFSDRPLSPGAHAIDSGIFYNNAYNPVVTAMLPAVAAIVRGGLIAPARNTVTIQHTARQLRLMPRFETNYWGLYGVPGGGIGGFVGTDARITIDSTDATQFTQANDIAFPQQIEGQSLSDTRELLWEYAAGRLIVDAARAQGASGNLISASGIPLTNLDISVISNSETATILWTVLDTTRSLAAAGRSLLTVATRTEAKGMTWLDSSTANPWGSDTMMVEPVRARLTFRPADSVNLVRLIPLDMRGVPTGDTITGRKSGSSSTVAITLDQSQSRTMLYAVELEREQVAGVSPALAVDHAELNVLPSVVESRAYIEVALPRAEAEVRVTLHDGQGRTAGTLHHGALAAGHSTLRLDASRIPAGTYLVRLTTGSGTTATQSIIVRGE